VVAPGPARKPVFHSISSVGLMNNDSTHHASIQEVYAAVAGAASQNPKEMSASAARLKDLMDQPGTLDLLQQIAAQKTAPLHIRQLSIIQVKNVVSTLWRSRRSVNPLLCLFVPLVRNCGFTPVRLVLDDQRPAIRNRCLTLLDEGDDVVRHLNPFPLAGLVIGKRKIGKNNEVIIAKIARSDFPHKWCRCRLVSLGVLYD
jgi:hypothetical protein